jgi:hypothetical protein
MNQTEVNRYADQIMRDIDETIADGTMPHGKRMPADIASFSVLHDYVDANTYVNDALEGAFPVLTPAPRSCSATRTTRWRTP